MIFPFAENTDEFAEMRRPAKPTNPFRGAAEVDVVAHQQADLEDPPQTGCGVGRQAATGEVESPERLPIPGEIVDYLTNCFVRKIVIRWRSSR